MTVSKKQQACVNRYISSHYDRVSLALPSGLKGAIQAEADLRGQSMTEYIVQAVRERMERDRAVPDGGEK